ncbi:ribonuclease HII [Virgibacillus halophilus]|uniref:Ribonuclease HII n=1 Tax=Tigheibacillus halophilus TaxID=361280 RepID=A0ABU5CAW0_9BACI|nr:ribonuclease HII [Virgibacillus halophilus]
MEKLSIVQIKELLKTEKISAELLEKLRLDDRKGIKSLLKSYDNKREKKRLLLRKYKDMSKYELKNRQTGCRFIAGVDEAGRGPLAGPVVAGAVILPEDFVLLGLDDSKQLNRTTRESFYDIIVDQAVSYGIGIVDNNEIDSINIYKATKMAMHRAVDQLQPEPDHVLIDAVPLERLGCTSESFPKGDQKSVSIAAASILAKVTRDRIMDKLHREFPVYSFASNMGYGTKEHMEALRTHGISPYHRISFAPVKETAK